MSLVGDLEFKTKIDNKPAIIKMPNACLDIDILSENGHREINFSIDSNNHQINCNRKIIFTIKMLDDDKEEDAK